MASQNIDIDRFCDLVQPWAGGVNRITQTALLSKFNGKFFIRFGRAWIDNDPSSPSLPDLFLETASVLALRETKTLKSESYSRFLWALSESPHAMIIMNEHYEIPCRGIYRDPPRTYFEPLHVPRLRGALRLPMLQISDPSTSASPSLHDRATDVELFAADPPFRGISDLLSELGFEISVADPSHMPRIEIFVRAPVSLGSASGFTDDGLQIAVSIPAALDAAKIAMRTISIPRVGPVLRENVTEKLSRHPTIDGSIELRALLNGNNALWAIVFVSYDGHHLAEFQLRNDPKRPQIFAEVHEHYHGDKGFIQLLPELGQKKLPPDSQHRFESAISLALSLSGLRIFPYGQIKEFSDGPDILCLSDHGDLVIVECTVGYPNNEGKLFKLAERARSLRAYAKDSGLNIRSIFAAMMTSLPSSDIESAREQATSFGISLFCREEIIELFRQATNSFAPAPDAIASKMQKKIDAKNALLI